MVCVCVCVISYIDCKKKRTSLMTVPNCSCNLQVMSINPQFPIGPNIRGSQFLNMVKVLNKLFLTMHIDYCE